MGATARRIDGIIQWAQEHDHKVLREPVNDRGDEVVTVVVQEGDAEHRYDIALRHGSLRHCRHATTAFGSESTRKVSLADIERDTIGTSQRGRV